MGKLVNEITGNNQHQVHGSGGKKKIKKHKGKECRSK
jgi:hypothetical protein